MGFFLIASLLMADVVQGNPAAADPAPVADPAPAAAAPVARSAPRTCDDYARKQQQQAPQAKGGNDGRAVAGVVGGALLGGLLGVRGVPIMTSVTLPLQAFLDDRYIDMLECDERLKAVGATMQVTDLAERQGIGASVAWRSDSRPGVTGASTVTAVDTASAGGQRCLTVTDVLIIGGEETTVPKRMCRTPPSARYQRI